MNREMRSDKREMINELKKQIELPNDKLISEIQRLIEKGHTVTIPVKGFSMRPFLESNRDTVVLAPFEQLNRGDVVLAEATEGGFVLHRIISIRANQLLLMGDGNLNIVERCDRKNVVALVTSVTRNGRKISTSSKSWLFYSNAWYILKPIRRYLLYIYRVFFCKSK